jgi:hypothetical protein
VGHRPQIHVGSKYRMADLIHRGSRALNIQWHNF